MNDPRKVLKELSELYQFHKKLKKAYSLPLSPPSRLSEAKPHPPSMNNISPAPSSPQPTITYNYK